MPDDRFIFQKPKQDFTPTKLSPSINTAKPTNI